MMQQRPFEQNDILVGVADSTVKKMVSTLFPTQCFMAVK